jgi:perosamine synthetase
MLDTTFKIANALYTVCRPWQFGFMQSHVHFDDAQLIHLKTILESGDVQNDKQVIHEYEVSFAGLVGDGFASSFASARMAFYTLMKVLKIGEGDEVVLPAFTCSVMPNAVLRVGARPVYADIDRYTFGSSAEAIQRVLTKRTKLIVAQHSFGIPCDIDEITSLSQKKGIFLLEDSSITLDSSLNGINVGNWGDAAIFSTDHSKPLNTIIGGILYTRNRDLQNKVANFSEANPNLSAEHQRNLFNQLLFERKYNVPNRYPHVILHNYAISARARLFGDNPLVFLENDYTGPKPQQSPYPYPAAMPALLAQVGIYELKRWREERLRRKELLSQYIKILMMSPYSSWIPVVYNDPARSIVPLRFVFLCPHANKFLLSLRKYVDVNWIWFRQPVICAIEGLESLGYNVSSCPVSEEITSKIVNLPCNVVQEWESKLLDGFRDSMMKKAFI